MYLPDGQLEHPVAEDVVPLPKPYVSTGHSEHTTPELPALYFPLGQGMHTVAPVVDTKVPAEHVVQELDRAEENVPGLQVEGAASPVVGQKDPAGQWVQERAPGDAEK